MVKKSTGQRKRETGISQLEFVVALLITSLLMLFLYLRVENMAEDVERVSFEGVQSNLQAQITLKVAYWYAVQKETDAEVIEKTNPITLVQHRPSNYAGELSSDELKQAAAEHWYFVTDKQWLVYKAKRTAYLNNRYGETALIPFRIKMRFSDSQHNNGVAVAASLQPVYGFEWQQD